MLFKDLPIGMKFHFHFDDPRHYSYERTGEFTCRELKTGEEFTLYVDGCYISKVFILGVE